MQHIDASVVVEEQRVIVKRRLEGEFLPRSRFNACGGKNVRLAGACGERTGVVGALVKPQAAGPGSLAVGFLAVSQGQRIVVFKDPVGVANQLPVHQIRRFHDRQPRAQMHRGAAHVVGAVHADDREVRDIRMDDGVARRFGADECNCGE